MPIVSFPILTIHLQVKQVEKRPQNAYHQAKDLDMLQACPREELHQILIGLYSEYVLPASFYIESTSIPKLCAAHFYCMYVNNHTGKHMTGDCIGILLLNMPFILSYLIVPEVRQYILTSLIHHDK